MNKSKILEIKKLWFVAEKYYDLAMDEKTNVPAEELRLTVEELSNRSPNLLDLKSDQHLIYFSAHLSSCAVRLCSIEENLKSKRLDRYNEIIGWSDLDRIQKRIRTSMNIYIHFFLRHMVAHSESKRLYVTKKNAQVVYGEMYKEYLGLDYETILLHLNCVKGEIENELNSI